MADEEWIIGRRAYRGSATADGGWQGRRSRVAACHSSRFARQSYRSSPARRGLFLVLGDAPPQRHHGLAAHSLADHRKRLLADRLVGGDIVRSIEKALVDLWARHKTVDIDHVGALDLDGFKFLVRDDQILPLGDLVAAALALGIDRLAGFLIDELLTQPIAGRLVDLPEGDALCGRAGSMQCDRARDQGQLKIAFPVRSHGWSPWFRIYAGV